MKAWIFSDLHLEDGKICPVSTVPEADICICAGDITNKLVRSIRFLGECISPHMPVLFVPGNHEYYGSSIREGYQEGLREAEDYPDVHLLHQEVAIFEGFRFVGATFWSDLQLFGTPQISMLEAQKGMTDYRQIKLSKKPFKRFSARHAQGLHWEDNLFIQRALWDEAALPTIVVTHHAPSILSVPPEFIDDPVAPSFASRFEKHIIKYRPRLWIHGHLHNRSDYMIQTTRVICNPKGYVDEHEKSGFDPYLVVDVTA
ncbi:metallophosphoesterase [Rhizobium sp. LjRoot258]|uniref:metallophosphoesterase n=1 Tax=Rhizobium sp. LjRoot258 TaxID=3342299 RepID=UPI003ECD312C